MEGDAIRNITGELSDDSAYGPLLAVDAPEDPNSAIYAKQKGKGASLNGSNGCCNLYFDASRVVPTAPENRPLNLGMTPAIYLGV